jgi:hypothetical protein
LVASGLDAQSQGRSASDSWFECKAATRSLAAGEPLRGGQFTFRLEESHERLLAIVCYHAYDIWKLTDFVRPPCRVATSDDHPHIRITSRDPPDRLSSALIRGRRNRTGVDDDKIRILRRRRYIAAPPQLLLNRE